MPSNIHESLQFDTQVKSHRSRDHNSQLWSMHFQRPGIFLRWNSRLISGRFSYPDRATFWDWLCLQCVRVFFIFTCDRSQLSSLLLVPWTENHLSCFKCGFLNIFSSQNLLRGLSSLLFLLQWNKNRAKKCLKSHIPFDF